MVVVVSGGGGVGVLAGKTVLRLMLSRRHDRDIYRSERRRLAVVSVGRAAFEVTACIGIAHTCYT